jgi:type IV pilus assembly protein PilN
MIKINLLQEKKPKRTERGQQSLLAGFLGIMLAGVAVYFFVHAPLSDSIRQLEEDQTRLERSIRQLKEDTKEFDTVQAQLKGVEDQEAAIQRLNQARAVPAWMLAELSNILTKDRKPTMTAEMEDRVRVDPNRQLTPGWDPKRLWIDTIEETQGTVTIKGGAQSDTDVTQFTLRLQASVFFSDVVPETGNYVEDNTTKVKYYKYTISGKVSY